MFCMMSVHRTPPPATWRVWVQGEQLVCSSCHFLMKRKDASMRDQKLPIDVLAFRVDDLPIDELWIEIQKLTGEAEAEGYGLPWDVLSLPGEDGLRITFRRVA